MSELIAELAAAAVPLCIVTTSPRPYCSRVVTHPGWPITNLVCYHDTDRRTLKLLGCPPEKCCAVLDHSDDATAARAAGVFSVGATWGLPVDSALIGCDFLAPDVATLRTFLLKGYGLAG